MKIKVMLKDPDGFYEAVSESVAESVDAIEGDLTEYEKESVRDRRHEEIDEFMRHWVEHGEYVTLEFDTLAKTATVLKRIKA